MSRSYTYLMQSLASLAAFVVITTFAFGRSAANPIDFGVAIAITLLGIAAIRVANSRSQRAVAAVAALAGAWTVIVNAGVFDGSTQRWLTFAAAAGIAGVASLAEVASIRRADESSVVTPLSEARAA